MEVSAVALILGGAMLLVTGSSRRLGESFRGLIEPLLVEVRTRTSLSRSQLADLSILAAMVLAGLTVTDGNIVGAMIIAPLLYLARPAIRRATREENRLMAVGGMFGLDLMIGVYLPFALAHVLLFDWFMASSLFTVVVALSWPAGGGGAVPGRRWLPAPA
jgi:hypothetical protein